MNQITMETRLKYRAYIDFGEGEQRQELRPYYASDEEARAALRDLANQLQGRDRLSNKTRAWNKARFVVEPVRVNVPIEPARPPVTESAPGRPDGPSAREAGSA